MMKLGLLGLAGVSATTWYASHDLSESEVTELTNAGCYRGSYGNYHTVPTLHLSTCHREGAERFAELHDDAFLCALELAETSLVGHVADVIATSNVTKVVYQAQQVTVIADFGDLTQLPDLCIETEFNDGAIDNARYVPHVDIVPQRPMDMEHPANKRYLDSLKHSTAIEANPIIVDLLEDFNQDEMETFLRALAQRPGRDDTLVTRNSYSNTRGVPGSGGCASADWQCATDSTAYVKSTLEAMFADYSGSWSVESHTFRADMCDNMILRLDGDGSTDGMVVMGAHLDSRNTGSGSTATGVAPGADDNGTGSAVLLEMARVIAKNDQQFTGVLELEWYCGEEQGLLGSRQLAIRHRQRGDNIVGMFNNDMIGYTDPSVGVVLAFMTGSASPGLSAACKAFVSTYIPTLPTGDTNACCSDQQSYFAEGFPAAGIFETTSNRVVYPEYHRVGDTVDNGLINMEQVFLFGKANLACSMEYAGPL